MSNPGEITGLLNRARAGDAVAANEAFNRIYGELKRIAQHALGRGPRETLSATALVHEAYLKLFEREHGAVADRAHFFRLCARAMRQIIVDQARASGADKRGGALIRTGLSDELAAAGDSSHDLLAIDQALSRLEHKDGRLALIVEAHFFGGLTFDEIARELELSERTVRLDWATARALMLRDLSAPK